MASATQDPPDGVPPSPRGSKTPLDGPGASRRASRWERVRGVPRRALTALPGPELGVLAVVLVVALVLRLWNIGQNLPLVYNIDESARFVPDAAAFFHQRLGYRELVNPPGMMGLLGLVDQAWFRPQGLSPAAALARDPGEAYLLGRVVVALLSFAAVPVLHAAARRLVGPVAALVASGLLAVAFLPVAYSRVALADGPTLLFVALGLLGGAWLLQDPAGRRRGVLLSGIAVGLAAGFKYNAGIVVLVPLAALALRARGDGVGSAVRRTVLLGVVALAAFVVSNPYVLIDPQEVWRAIEYQAHWSAGGRYVGEPMTNGFAFYTWAAGWGVGWAPLGAAVVGAVLLAVRRPRVALLLLPMVAGYLLVMGVQDRFFARWLLPIVPVLVIAAGFLVQELAALVGRRSRTLGVAVAAALGLGLAAQSLIHSTHTAAVVGRADTRTVLRDWMLRHVPASSGVVLESMSPAAWMPTLNGSNQFWSLNRWSIYHTIPAVQRRDRRAHPQTRIKAGFSSWVRILYPELIDEFERYGYCTVVTSAYQAGRAGRTPELVPEARRYYRELTRRADLVWQISPFSRAATYPDGRGPWGPTTAPVKYQIDRQATTYELDYERPGPMISVYRLRGGRCAGATGSGPPAIVPNAPWR